MYQVIALVTWLASSWLANAGDAQQPTLPQRIGVLLAASLPEGEYPQAFREGLRDAGYIEGRDVVIEWRSANGDYARIPELSADLVRRKVDVIVVDSTPAAQALKRATSTIPIVMTSLADPVGSGLAASLAHPGGNVTGLTIMTDELSVKRLELLREIFPTLTRVAILWNPAMQWHKRAVAELKAAAASLSIKLNLEGTRTPGEFDAAVSAARRAHAQALYVIDDSLFYTYRARLIKLALNARIPTIWGQRASVNAGALMSYGPNYPDLYRRSAEYVDRILKRASPRDLPIEQPTNFEFVVNLKTAKALGIVIPESLLLRADQIIQ